MRLPTRLAVLGTSLALALSVAAPAEAARRVRTDASNDVVRVVCNDDNCASQTVDASRVEGDIRTVTTNHGTSAITVRVKFGELIAYKQFRFLDVPVSTNEGITRHVIVAFDGEAPQQGYSFLYDLARDTSVRCDYLTSKADYSYNTITVTVPRSCVSNPGSVTTGALYVRFPYGPTKNPAYADDVAIEGVVNSNLTALLAGPAVAKG